MVDKKKLAGKELEAYKAGFAWGYEHAVKDARDQVALHGEDCGIDCMYDRFMDLRKKRVIAKFLGRGKQMWTLED